MSSSPFVSTPAPPVVAASPPLFSVPVTSPPAKGASTNSTIAISVMVCVAAFVLFALLKFYSMCTSPPEDDRARRAGARRPGAQPPAKKGLDAHLIGAIPEHPFGEATEVETECAVCLGDYEQGEPVKQLPPCKHVFHSECINTWLSVRHTCPICRISLLPAEAADDKKGQQPAIPVAAETTGPAALPAHEDARTAAQAFPRPEAADGNLEQAPMQGLPEHSDEPGEEEFAMRRAPSIRMPAEVVEQVRAMADADDDELLSWLRMARSQSEGLGNMNMDAAADRGVRAASSLPRVGSGRSTRGSLSSGLRSLSVGRSEWVTIEMGAADGPDAPVSHAIEGLPESPDKATDGQAHAQGPAQGSAQGFVAEGQKAIEQTVNSITSAVRWLSKRTGTSSTAEPSTATNSEGPVSPATGGQQSTGPNAV